MISLYYILIGAFYSVLILYSGSEFYYHYRYWRIVLKKKRKKKWESLLWAQRTLLMLIGLSIILLEVLDY